MSGNGWVCRRSLLKDFGSTFPRESFSQNPKSRLRLGDKKENSGSVRQSESEKARKRASSIVGATTASAPMSRTASGSYPHDGRRVREEKDGTMKGIFGVRARSGNMCCVVLVHERRAMLAEGWRFCSMRLRC
jgi:hypothetical protein